MFNRQSILLVMPETLVRLEAGFVVDAIAGAATASVIGAGCTANRSAVSDGGAYRIIDAVL